MPRFLPLCFLIAGLAAFARGQDLAPTRRALLVGVSAYPAGCAWPALEGPRADVLEMQRVLRARGFPEAGLHVLLDEQATRAAIRSTFQELIEETHADDLLLFYFAGHGSELPDDDGDELDGWDETLVPYDALDNLGRPNDLRDDEIERWIALANQRTDQVVLIFDCCSSGTNTRGAEEGLGSARFLDPKARGLGSARASVLPRASERGSGWAPRALRYVALSACRARESAYEARVEGQGARGLFTLELLNVLEHAPDDWSYADLLLGTSLAVGKRTENQTPLVEGPLRSRRLFQDVPGASAPRFELVRDAKTGWQLEAGALSGLGEGALLCIAPRSAQRMPPAPLGRVRVATLGALASSVEWILGAPPSGEDARCAAFVLEAGAPTQHVAFEFAGARDEELAAALAGTGWLQERRTGTAFLELVRSETEPDTIGVRIAGGRTLPLHADRKDPLSRERFVRSLAHLGRAWSVPRVLESPSGAGELELAALDCDAEAQSVREAELDPRGGRHATLGRHLALRVRNHSKRALYPAVVIVAPDGEVLQFFTPTLDHAIPPGGEFVTPVGADPLSIDAGYEGFYAALPMRVCCLLTPKPVDLALLEQGPLQLESAARGGESQDSPDVDGQTWLSAALDLWLDPAR